MTVESADMLDRADSLIRQRRRSFVATRPLPDALPPHALTPGGEEEDLPILTEVILADAAAAATASAAPIDETRITLLAAEIAQAVERQLTERLPELIEAALLRTGDELRDGVSAIMDSALRDFLARRPAAGAQPDGDRSDT